MIREDRNDFAVLGLNGDPRDIDLADLREFDVCAEACEICVHDRAAHRILVAGAHFLDCVCEDFDIDRVARDSSPDSVP